MNTIISSGATRCALALLLASALSAAADFGVLPDPFSGNWEGRLAASGGDTPLYATLIENKTGYEVILRLQADPRSEPLVILGGKLQGDRLVLGPPPPAETGEGADAVVAPDLAEIARWQGGAQGRELTGQRTGPGGGAFMLVRRDFVPSPTLGASAPAGAVTLFDGSGLGAWESRNASAEAIQWQLTPAGDLEVVSTRDGKRYKQDLKTRDLFADYRLHLEFKLAHKPAATGQGRSNSGIFHLGYYETQILDSFGLYGRDNECGGIYKTREPDSNAGYPAGLWQTYDVEVRAARYDAAGTKVANARLTVRLNGVLIHDDVELPKPTAGGKEGPTGPIILQDHGSPVQFRNIWVLRR